MSVKPAKLLNDQVLSNDTTVLLNSINTLKNQFDSLKFALTNQYNVTEIPLKELSPEEMNCLNIPVQRTLDGGLIRWLKNPDGSLRRIIVSDRINPVISVEKDCNDQK